RAPAKLPAAGQPDRPRLADVVTEPGAAAALAVERQLRILVEDVVHIANDLEPVVPFQRRGRIHQRVGRKPERADDVVRRSPDTRDWVEEDGRVSTGGRERVRARLLVARLGETVADALDAG